MFEHSFGFDPTYGYDEAGLRSVQSPPAPDDFEAFWRSRYDAACALRPEPEVVPEPGISNDDVEVSVVRFWALGLDGKPAIRIGGWLVRPRRVKAVRAVVVGHGYGGRSEPDRNPVRPPAVRLFVCMRGFDLSRQPDLPDTAARHVLHGIDRRETYLHLGCAADLWAAVGVLHERYPEFRDVTDYVGGSFGGGIGALAMPWDARVRRVVLDVPSFGNHPLRLTLPCVGSGEAVRMLHQRGHDVLPVLRYFDAATAAGFLKQPTLVSAARFDPAVPPPGQVAVYNAIPHAHKRLILRDGGHFEYPALAEQQRVRDQAIAHWFDV